MESKFDKVLEGFKPLTQNRVFYPRNMKLSEDFINAFHREYDRLVDEGQNPKSLVPRFGKALKFHATEERKYKKLDEELARKAAIEEGKKKKMKKKKGHTYGMGDGHAGDGDGGE